MTKNGTQATEAIDYWNDKADFFASGERQDRSRRMSDLYEASCWRYIEPVLPTRQGSLILEAGCGTGRWVYHLAPLGYQVALLDFSGEMIRHAEAGIHEAGLEKHIAGYHVKDICEMSDFQDNSVDLILALGIPLSLCGNPEQAVKEMSRITKPGGHVVCDAMNRFRTALDMARKNDMDQLLNALNKGCVTTESGLTQHCFSPEELESLFRKYGLGCSHVMAIAPFFDFPPSREHVEILDDDFMYDQISNVFQAVAEDPGVIAVSSRLLVVTQKPDPQS